MKILIDIGHPAHFHLFRYFAIIMQKQGVTVLFTYRKKEFEKELLKAFGFTNICLGNHFKSSIGKVFGLIKINLLLLKVALKFKPDILLSHGSMYAAQVSSIIGKPHISLEDSGNMEQIRFYLPFTEAVLTPDILPNNLGKKQIKYQSFHELAYLHPKYFKANKSVLRDLYLKDKEKYAFIRFVSWNATHDNKQKGLSIKQKEDIVDYLSSKMKVFISSERPLPVSLKKYSIHTNPQDIHHLLAFAEIVVSEGATMASEAGVLGTPSIYINTIVACNNKEQEKYHTVYNFRNGSDVLNKIKEIISDSKYKQMAITGRKKMLKDKINTTDFLVWFIENYPNSVSILKENPNYQDRFKN